jgi:hypothetical protein
MPGLRRRGAGALDAETLGSHPSCETLDHGTDPLACFDEVFEGTV